MRITIEAVGPGSERLPSLLTGTMKFSVTPEKLLVRHGRRGFRPVHRRGHLFRSRIREGPSPMSTSRFFAQVTAAHHLLLSPIEYAEKLVREIPGVTVQIIHDSVSVAVGTSGLSSVELAERVQEVSGFRDARPPEDLSPGLKRAECQNCTKLPTHPFHSCGAFRKLIPGAPEVCDGFTPKPQGTDNLAVVLKAGNRRFVLSGFGPGDFEVLPCPSSRAHLDPSGRAQGPTDREQAIRARVEEDRAQHGPSPDTDDTLFLLDLAAGLRALLTIPE